MSQDAPPPGEAARAVALEAAYYQTVEEAFVARRGPPLTLSNADWTLIRKWHQAGIPLRVVLRGVADALDIHAHSFARAQPVGSLRYCEAEVAVAYERWQRALAGTGSSESDVTAALTSLADACDNAAQALPPRLAAHVARLAAEVRERAAGPADTRIAIEAWLAAREVELVKRLRRAAGAPLTTQLEAEIDADLAPYRERLPDRVLQQVRADAFARCLLERHALPRLSLFAS